MPNSRVWILPGKQDLSVQEALAIEGKSIAEFSDQWKSHGVPVKGRGLTFFSDNLSY
jgi:hypothetical protein